MTANLSWITDNLATGGDLSYNKFVAQQQFDELLDMNLGLVIDMRQEDDDSELWAKVPNTAYVNIKTDDADGYHMPYEAFDEVVHYAKGFLDEGYKVFIHCHMGVNRGPSAALAVLLDQSMPATKA
jgi:dual specificity phosphatase 3